MKQKLGLWRTYRSGEVANFLSSFLKGSDPILFLQEREREQGIRGLINSLICGLDLQGLSRQGPFQITLYLHAPEESEERRLRFADEITAWLEGIHQSFTQACFGSSHPSFIHSPLERSLKKRFGFGLEYKILVEEGDER